MARQIEVVRVLDIQVGRRHRAPTESAVTNIAESMKCIGLQSPILVRWVDEMEVDGRPVCGVPVLVAGATRLAAAKRLGWEKIDAVGFDGDEIDAELAEIAENLHRAELTVQERAEHIAEWVRLTEKKQQRVLVQVEPKPHGGRPAGGVRAAERELGLGHSEAQRAIKIASITDEAKEAAREAGISDNQSALLAVAKAPPDQQAAAARQWVSPDRIAKKADARELREQAMERLAERLSEHIPGEEWPALLTELEAIGSGAKPVIDAFRRLNGAVFDATASGGRE